MVANRPQLGFGCKTGFRACSSMPGATPKHRQSAGRSFTSDFLHRDRSRACWGNRSLPITERRVRVPGFWGSRVAFWIANARGSESANVSRCALCRETMKCRDEPHFTKRPSTGHYRCRKDEERRKAAIGRRDIRCPTEHARLGSCPVAARGIDEKAGICFGDSISLLSGDERIRLGLAIDYGR